MGGKFYIEKLYIEKIFFLIKGSASTRITGQSVDEQLKNTLPPSNGK
jgi:hypothetical protein